MWLWSAYPLSIKNVLMCEVPRRKCITYQKWSTFTKGHTKHFLFSELTRRLLWQLLEKKKYCSVLTITFCLLDHVEDEVNKKYDDGYKCFFMIIMPVLCLMRGWLYAFGLIWYILIQPCTLLWLSNIMIVYIFVNHKIII